MTAMLEKDKAFISTNEGKRAFTEIKHFLTNLPILAYPDFSVTFMLDTDASDLGIGAVLSQKGKDELENPIEYYSRGFNKHENTYSVTRKELLAAIDSMEHFKCYLHGKKFVLRTDHAAIQWLKNFKDPTGQLARLLERMSMFKFIIQHRPGKRHANADGLSRIQHETEVLAVIEDNDNKINWHQLQHEDPFLERVINWVETHTRPSAEETRALDAEELTLWARFEELGMINKGLCLLTESNTGLRSLIVVPRKQRASIINDYHCGPGGGHFAFEKKNEKLKFRLYWPDMKRDIEIYCAKCQRCAARKAPSSTAKAKLMSMGAGFPFERIAMDIVGPLPKTERGNRYLLVVVDYYTRWPEAYAIVLQDAHSIASKLVTEYFARYGAPYSIHSNQGANFESNLMRNLLFL